MQKFYRSDNRLIWGDNNRELKQRGRRRQRQKTNRFRMSKQQHAFFLYISLQDYDVKMPYVTFYHEDVNTRQRLSFLFPEL